jgi:hypothetical protein
MLEGAVLRSLHRVNGAIAILSLMHAAAAAPKSAPVAGRPPAVAPNEEVLAPSTDQDERLPDLPAQPAQAAPAGAVPPSARSTVPVWFEGSDGENPLVEIYPDGVEPGTVPALARCHLPCGLSMARGRYVIHVAETADTLGGSRSVAIEGRSGVAITPRDRMKRTAGLVLGIGGLVVGIVGAALYADGYARAPQPYLCAEHTVCSPSWNAEQIGGFSALIASLALMPIGWVMFGKSFRPAIDIAPAQVGTGPGSHLALIGSRGGARLVGEFVF